jgi:competence protein ComEC
LLDCGSERNYPRVVRQYLHSAGVNWLDGLLLSHGDAAHIGGARQLLVDYAPVRLIDNPAPDRSRTHQRLLRSFHDRHIEPSGLTLGDRFQLSGNVTAEILYPPRIVPARKADDQAYVVSLHINQSTSILFISDNGAETERALMASGKDLRSDILVKGQHYSGRASSSEFLDAVQPKLIVATSRDFPENERISDLWAMVIEARGIKLFRQDRTGAVIMRFGRHGWKAKPYLTGEHSFEVKADK